MIKKEVRYVVNGKAYYTQDEAKHAEAWEQFKALSKNIDNVGQDSYQILDSLLKELSEMQGLSKTRLRRIREAYKKHAK